jgi:hypothetical protein
MSACHKLMYVRFSWGNFSFAVFDPLTLICGIFLLILHWNVL